MSDSKIMLVDVGKALRAYRDKHGKDATSALMKKIGGTDDIRKIPADDKIRQALIDAATPEGEEPPVAQRRERTAHGRSKDKADAAASPFSEAGAAKIYQRFNKRKAGP